MFGRRLTGTIYNVNLISHLKERFKRFVIVSTDLKVQMCKVKAISFINTGLTD